MLALFDAHEGGFSVSLPMAVVEEGGKLELAELIRLCSFDPISRLLALKQKTKIDWPHYVEKEQLFLNYDLKGGGVRHLHRAKKEIRREGRS